MYPIIDHSYARIEQFRSFSAKKALLAVKCIEFTSCRSATVYLKQVLGVNRSLRTNRLTLAGMPDGKLLDALVQAGVHPSGLAVTRMLRQTVQGRTQSQGG